MRHCKHFWLHCLHVQGLHSWVCGPRAAGSFHALRFSNNASMPSGLRMSQDMLRQLEKSVSQLDSMLGQLNDTSSLKVDQIRDLQRQVNRLEPVAALVSQHRHIESEVLAPSLSNCQTVPALMMMLHSKPSYSLNVTISSSVTCVRL